MARTLDPAKKGWMRAVSAAAMGCRVCACTGDGNTCNLGQNPGLVDLPHIAMDEYNYNQFFSDAGHNVPFDPAVGGYFSGTGDPRYGYPGEARGCGACLEVTGANGTLTFMVWEIADIGAVGANGTPTNVHLENTYIDQVRSGSGVASDVTIRPVPCPIGGDIQLKARIFNFDQPWLNAIYYTPYNYVYPIKKLEMRAATHTEWYELKRDWTNRFHYENYGGMMDMPHDDTNSSVQFRITSIYDDVVVSEPIQLSTGQEYRYFDLGVNFTPRPVSAGACSSPNHLCGNKQSDPGEICQPAADAPVTCDSLGLGSGIAPCDPFTCDWDTSRCGKDPGTCAYPSELGGNDCNAAFFPSLGTDSCTCL